MSVVDDTARGKSVRSQFEHPRRTRDYVWYQLGVIDGEARFGRFFSAERGFVNLTYQVEEFVKRGMLFSNKGKDNAMDKTTLQQLRQIWHGPIWLAAKRDPIHNAKVLWRKIAYKRINGRPDLDVIRLPALKNMDPLDELKSEKLLLRVRESGKMSERLGGLDFRQAVLQGRLFLDYLNNREPYFRNQNELEHTKAITMTAGRRWFHATINFLEMAYRSKATSVYVDICQICEDDLHKGFEENKEEVKGPKEFIELK